MVSLMIAMVMLGAIAVVEGMGGGDGILRISLSKRESSVLRRGEAAALKTRFDGVIQKWPECIERGDCVRVGIPKVPMTNDYNEVWVGTVSVGTPMQNFSLVLDSGSSNLWVPSVQCDLAFDTGCRGKHLYNESASHTALGAPCKALFIPYGTGFVLGYLSLDTVVFGGVPITNVTFGQALYMAAFFAQVPIDGILGLGFPLIATDAVLPVLDTMWKQRLIPKFMFSTYLSSTPSDGTSMLFLGGVDPRYYTGPIVWADVILPSYWLVGMKSVAVAGKKVHSCAPVDCPAVIDTGTSILVFSPEVGNPILAQIGNVNADCSNVASLPTIAFELGGVMLTLEPAFYVIQYNNTCQLGIQTSIEVFPLNILGDPFLRKYYTIFDRDSTIQRAGDAEFKLFPRVGFALAVQQ